MGPIETYIRQAAAARGIDPDIAVRIARAEGGLTDPVRQSEVVKNGVREQSYGPFQLYLGGGLGNQALKAGIDPRDPNQWQRGVDFALDEAARNKSWSHWYGRGPAGVGVNEGFSGGARPGEQSVAEFRNRPQQPPAAPGTVPPMGTPTYVGNAPVATPVAETGRDALAQTAAPAAQPGMMGWLKSHLKTGEQGEDARKNLATAMAGMAGKQQTMPQIVQPKAARVDDPTIATIDPQQALMQRQQMAEIMAKLNSGKLWA